MEGLNNVWILRNTKEKDLKRCFFDFAASDFLHLILEGDSASELFDLWQGQFELIQAGGGVVWNENNELLMIERLGKWDLPKGKLDEGEDMASCAIREVEEETGLRNISLNGFMRSTYHIYPLKGSWVLKQTDWYKMKAPKQKLVPQASEGITQSIWVERNDINDYISDTYQNIKYLMQYI